MKALKIILGILLIVVLAFFAVGLFASEVTYQNTVTIDRSPEQVWEVFHQSEKLGSWLDGFERIENLSGNKLEVGSRWKLFFDQDGEKIEIVEQVTAVKTNELYAFDLETDPFLGATEILLEPLEAGQTRLTAKTRINGRNLFWRSLMRLSKGYMIDQSQQSYDKLKQVVESSS